MNYYENLFIIHPSYEEERLSQAVTEVKKKIEELGGTIYTIDDWGKRRLAYIVRGQKYGNYVLARFGSENDIISELEAWMKVNQAILMEITIRLDSEPVEEETTTKSG